MRGEQHRWLMALANTYSEVDRPVALTKLNRRALDPLHRRLARANELKRWTHGLAHTGVSTARWHATLLYLDRPPYIPHTDLASPPPGACTPLRRGDGRGGSA